jgi:hypothetical protein
MMAVPDPVDGGGALYGALCVPMTPKSHLVNVVWASARPQHKASADTSAQNEMGE